MGLLTELTDWINDVSGNWWFILVIFAVSYLDSVFPIVPSETTVIIGGVAAGQGNQTLALVILAGATGAFLGDNTAYFLGNRFSGRVTNWASTRPKTQARFEWAEQQIRTRGGPLLVTARFIPGGRTALTITSGLTRQPRPWFMRWTFVAALIWAGYAAGLGWYFGERFKDDHTKAFWIAFGAALGITVLLEVVRHFRGDDDPDTDTDTDGDTSES